MAQREQKGKIPSLTLTLAGGGANMGKHWTWSKEQTGRELGTKPRLQDDPEFMDTHRLRIVKRLFRAA